jgi:hypothetical protein
MPRRINPKCLACAQLSTDEARRRHGPTGDGCWHEGRCHRRRSHYRHRRDINTQRREVYRQQVTPAGAGVPTLALSVPLAPVAYLYLYRGQRRDAPLHAIAIAVWQGETCLLQVTPIHCAGMRTAQIQAYLTTVLGDLQQQFGICKFEPEIRLEPQECPLSPCPLKVAPTGGQP